MESSGAPQGARLFLIDAMSYIFRAFHALPRLTNRQGLPTHAVYGLNNMLRKLLADYQPEYVAAVFDLAGPTFRHEQFADYKANRAEMPDELAQQLPYVHQLLTAWGIPEASQPGYEADDVIGALAHQYATQNLDVLIISSDKDMLQLVGDRVCVINPMKADLLCDRQMVEQLMGVGPERIPDLLGLLGDVVDNIPGAPGIGEKGARELLQRYGTVEAALEHAGEVSRKNYRESLLNYREQILLSKRLATIDISAPVAVSLESLRRRQPDPKLQRDLYQELGFSTLLKELPAVPVTRGDYGELTAEAELKTFLASAHEGRAAAVAFSEAPRREPVPEGTLDFEALPPPDIGLSTAPGVARTVSGALLPAMRGWLQDSASPKAVHDLKAALLTLHPHGMTIAGVRDDSLLYSYLLDATEGRHDLQTVAEQRLGVRVSEDVAERADLTGQLTARLEAEIRQAGLERVYRELELPLAPILAGMEHAGIRLDVQQLSALGKRLEKDLERLCGEIYQLTGTEFNINSPKQLGDVLFNKLALPQPRKYGKGKIVSTAVDILEELAAQHEAPRRVLEYRQLAKLKSTYVEALPQLVNPATGRLHTSFNQAGTATGRLSSSNPNLQNIPIRTELGREIRAAFVAEPGHVLLAADYSQIELRLLAHFSEDPLLVDAFLRGDDIHALTASAVFGVPAEAQTSEHRRRAKAINYGIVYGISAFGLAQQLGVSQAEAQTFIDNYFNRYTGVSAFIERTLQQVRESGEVRTLFGRLRRIADIRSRDYNARGFAERTAVNTPLQGSAADLIKLAMIRVDAALREQRLGARLLLQVHDELVLEAPLQEQAQAAAVLQNAMEKCWELNVPLVASVAAGPNWRDLADMEG